MKTEPSPEIIEIIEIIDDEDDDGGLRDSRVDSSPGLSIVGSRWFGPAIAAVFLAVAGYVVVSSSIDSNPRDPRPPGLIRSQYYVADAPPGFGLYMAEARGEAGTATAAFADPDLAELWATPGATATTGSWFVVSRGQQHSTGRNAYRTIVDGVEVVVERDPASGQSRLSFTKNGHTMAITAFGWLDRQLVRLVRAVNLDDSVIRFSDGFFTSDHQRILRADPTLAVFGLPVARVGYTTGVPADLAEAFTITVAGDNVDNESRVASFALTDITEFSVGDLPAIVGRWAADPSVTVAQWHDGDRLITMHGNLEQARLEAIAQTVRESPTAQVRDQIDAASPPVVEALRAEPRTVVSGMLSDGWGWAIQVSPRNADDEDEGYLWWIGQPGDTTRPSETRPSQPGNAPKIETFVEHGRTYVVGRIPRSMAGAELRVAPTGLASIVTKLHEVDPALPDEFAAAVFMEPVTFTARIVDADGTTVASWPTFGRAES